MEKLKVTNSKLLSELKIIRNDYTLLQQKNFNTEDKQLRKGSKDPNNCRCKTEKQRNPNTQRMISPKRTYFNTLGDYQAHDTKTTTRNEDEQFTRINTKSKDTPSRVMPKITDFSKIVKQEAKNDNLIKLSNMVLSFIAEMSKLQESISKKVSNVHDLKKEFEHNKSELLNFAKVILGRQGKPTASIIKSTRNLYKKDNQVIEEKINNKPKIRSITDDIEFKDLGNGQEIVNIRFKENNENEKLINAFEKLKREKIVVDGICEALTKEKNEFEIKHKSVLDKLKSLMGKHEFGSVGNQSAFEELIEILILKCSKFNEEKGSFTKEILKLTSSLNEYKSNNKLIDQELKVTKTENLKLILKENQLNKLISDKDNDIESNIIMLKW